MLALVLSSSGSACERGATPLYKSDLAGPAPKLASFCETVEVTGPHDTEDADSDPPVNPDRMIFLTDGVVAIAMTLLVLDLQITSLFGTSVSSLWRVLTAQQSKFVAFFIAFWVIAHLWTVHHRLFRWVERHSATLAQRNLWFLFAIIVLPFTTALMGHAGNNPLPVVFFSANLILATLTLQWLAWTIRSEHLAAHAPDVREELAFRVRGITVLVLCAIPIALTWVSTNIAEFSFLLFFISNLPGRVWMSRRDARDGRGLTGPTDRAL